MKKILFLNILFLFLIHCNSSDTKFPSEDKKWEGWAGQPEKPGKMPFDYFYIKSVARASQKSIEKKSMLMMRDTCKDAGTAVAKTDLFSKISLEVANSCGEDCEDSKKELSKNLNDSIKQIKLKECIPIAEAELGILGSEWKECECIAYAHIPGGKDKLTRDMKNQ